LQIKFKNIIQNDSNFSILIIQQPAKDSYSASKPSKPFPTIFFPNNYLKINPVENQRLKLLFLMKGAK
jgi:hypothetical protein